MFETLPDLLTISECCEILGVGNHTVYSLINEGKIRACRVGSKMLRVPKTSLAVYVLKESGIEVEEEEVGDYA